MPARHVAMTSAARATSGNLRCASSAAIQCGFLCAFVLMSDTNGREFPVLDGDRARCRVRTIQRREATIGPNKIGAVLTGYRMDS